MNQIKSVFSYLLFLVIGVICVYFSFRNQDIHSLIKTIQSINYFWYLPVLLCTIICHIARTKRWQLLLDQNEYKSNTLSTYNALMSAYLVNFATGKLGEFYRCGILRKENDIPFTYSLATVFIERVIDVLSLLILFIFTALFNYKIIYSFYQKYLEAQFTQTNFNIFILFLFVFLVSICVLYFYRQMILSYFNNRFSAFYSGLKSIYIMKEKRMFLFYTFLIWMMYLLMTYFWFFAFEDAHLSIHTALLVIVIGGIGRSLPVPAHGLGTYHLCASFALSAMLVNDIESTTIPVVIHAGQSIFYLVFGTLSMILINFPRLVLKKTHRNI